MRRFGVQGAYEQLKEVTRGKTVTAEALHGLIRSLEIPQAEKDRLLAMTPASYTGKAAELAQAALADGAQIHHLQGEPRGRRHRPRLLRRPRADAGAPSERDRRADDDPAGRAGAQRAQAAGRAATATARWPSAPACPTRTTPTSALRDFTGADAAVDRGRPARGQAAHQGLRQGRRGAASTASTTRPRSGGAASRTSSRGRTTCSVFRVPTAASQALAALAQRSMQLQATIQEGALMLGDGARNVDIEPVRWK